MAASAQLLHDLSEHVVHAGIDLSRYFETYYFHDRAEASFAAALPYVTVLVDAARRTGGSQLALAADVLSGALDDLLHLVDSHYLHSGGDRAEILARLARDYRHDSSAP